MRLQGGGWGCTKRRQAHGHASLFRQVDDGGLTHGSSVVVEQEDAVVISDARNAGVWKHARSAEGVSQRGVRSARGGGQRDEWGLRVRHAPRGWKAVCDKGIMGQEEVEKAAVFVLNDDAIGVLWRLYDGDDGGAIRAG